MDEVKLCPICGYDYVAPVGVYVRTKAPHAPGEPELPTLHAITSAGCSTSEDNLDDEGGIIRGVIVIREFLGECGHRWIEEEQFHKGNTLKSWRQLPAHHGPTDVIWRD